MKMYYNLRMLSKYPLRLFVALLMAWGGLPASAQDALINPQSGNLITAYTHQALEVGFQAGYGSYWQHKQLPITYSCSDYPKLSKDGVLRNHTCNFLYYKKNGEDKLIHVVGVSPNYSSIALPKGYKITGYKIVIRDGLNKHEDHAILDDVLPTLPFGRKKPWFFGEVDKLDIIENSETGGIYSIPKFREAQKITILPGKPGRSYKIERKGADMGNILYFCFAGNMEIGNLAGFVYDTIQISFTANDAFESRLVAAVEHSDPVSLSENPFLLGKTDVGQLSLHTKNGKSFYSYDQRQTWETTASINLYEQGATDGNTWDGTRGNKIIRYVKAKDKRADSWYALKPGTYFVEAPTTAKVQGESGDVKVPVGYRITGVKFEHKKGEYEDPGFKFKSKNSKPNYLSVQLMGVNHHSSGAVWHRTGNDELYTMIDGEPWYLIHEGQARNGQAFQAQLSKTNKHVSYLFEGDMPYVWAKAWGGADRKYWLIAPNNQSAWFKDEVNNNRMKVVAIQQSKLSSTPFRLKIGDEKGVYNKVLDVTDRLPDGEIAVNGYNNDAVKFQIEALPGHPDPIALLNITVKMEALNPYIDSVDVVCTGAYNVKMKRTFHAKDFRLGGKEFIYRVPVGFSENPKLPFSFEILKSKYADNTYWDKASSHHSRFCFVGSEYYKTVRDDIYGKSDIVANYPYEKKVIAREAGNVPFPFNNAADLSNTSTMKPSAYFSEKIFTYDGYNHMTVKDEAGHTIKGNYSQDNAKLEGNQTKTMYLYTTDETRYNIAPTKKELHRVFAYYHTTITLKFQNYEAKVKWIPLYNNPMFYKDKDNKHFASKPMFGVEIQTTESGFEGQEHQFGATSEFGYLTLDQIVKVLEEAIKQHPGPNVPKDLSEVLYVDASKLFDIIPTRHDQQLPPILEGLRAKLAKNALIYLPYRAAVLADVPQTALQTTDGTGFGCKHNLVITDKLPFFVPHDIQLNSDCYASYTRRVTAQGKGRVDYATLVLPYGLTVNGDGVHINNAGDASQFCMGTIYKNTLVYKDGDKNNHEGGDYGITAHLKKLDAGKSEANKPYIINILPGFGDANVSFVANEKGALIKKTPDAPSGLLASDAVNCKIRNVNTSLKSYYTYAGHKISKNGNEMVFYFSLNRFVAFNNLSTDTLYLYPFRSVYYADNYKVLQSKGFNSFGLTFDDAEDVMPTDIQDVQEEIVLKVTVGAGQITAEASKDVPLNIFNLSGQGVARTMIKGGETRTFYLAPGVYMVNGKKMIVN